METNKTFYHNENRTLTLLVYDQDHKSFGLDSAFASIEDEDSNIVVDEQGAMVNGNSMSITVDDRVTENVGTYYVIWRILESTNIYYHKTRLYVTEL